jgi:hypothetical protein
MIFQALDVFQAGLVMEVDEMPDWGQHLQPTACDEQESCFVQKMNQMLKILKSHSHEDVWQLIFPLMEPIWQLTEYAEQVNSFRMTCYLQCSQLQ